MHFLYLFINGADDYFTQIVLKHFNLKKKKTLLSFIHELEGNSFCLESVFPFLLKGLQ